jgi:membrane protease YdiL (CAAX protease family)
MRRSNAAPALGFVALLAAFWSVAKYFGIPGKLGDHVASAMLSFALLLAPYWAFGFGFGEWLKARVRGTARTFVPLLLILPYLIFTLPRGEFRWDMCLGMAGIVLAVSLLAPYARADWLVLAILGISVDLHFFDRAWPVAGLTGMSKLLFVDAGLYAYLAIRPLGGIGFDFRLRRSDIAIGLREVACYAPIALALGFALRFLHFHRTLGSPLAFGAGWLFTLFFVAMPEELFFRGLMLNMLERRLGTARALAVTSTIFGLAHFNKRAAYFNWRYVILAAVAGVFYGRAWLAKRRLMASSITHATVDTVWSIWLR